MGFYCLARIVNFDRDKQDPQNFPQRGIQLNIRDNSNPNQCVKSFEINVNLIALLKIQAAPDMLNNLARRYSVRRGGPGTKFVSHPRKMSKHRL